MKDFGKNYLEYSDSGVLVKYIGDNGIDIDDYIQSLLDKKDQEMEDACIAWLQDVEKVKKDKDQEWKDKIYLIVGFKRFFLFPSSHLPTSGTPFRDEARTDFL